MSFKDVVCLLANKCKDKSCPFAHSYKEFECKIECKAECDGKDQECECNSLKKIVFDVRLLQYKPVISAALENDDEDV